MCYVFNILFHEIFKDVIKDNGHSITYTLSRDEAVVVKYKQDENTDMFQVIILF